jgi:uncharacterized repeat protein (TIGR01451 family)
MRVSRLLDTFLAALAGFLFATPPLAAAVSFLQPLATSWTTVPTDTSGLAVADFDGDGVLDIAVCLNAGGGGKGIALMLGNGGASFQAPWILSTMPDDPISLLARDFDGDGVMDLVTTFPGRKAIAFLKGRGDGTLETPRSFATLNSAWIVQTADLNGDGRLDLVTGDSEGTAEVLLGNGDGTFLPPTAHTVGTLPQDVAIADLDGVNGPDIVVGSYLSTSFSILLNDGSGTFPAAGTNTPTTLQVRGLQVADFDGDLKKDVLVFGDGANLNVGLFRGNGDGTFQPRVYPDGFVAVEGRPNRNYSENVTPDLDGDGKPDVLLPRIDTNFVTVGFGNGDGTFRWQEYVASPGLGAAGAFYDQMHPWTAAFGDMNGDGRLDIVVGRRIAADNGAPVSILPGAPTGFAAPRSYPLSTQWSQASLSLMAGDFNEDGSLDLLTITDALELIPGNGDGTFGTSTRALGRISGSGEFYNTLRAADLDKDNHLDAVFLATDGVQAGPPPRILVAFGSGSGTLPDLVVLYPGDATAGPRNAVLADFNGDTFPDLAVLEAGASGGSVDLYLNNQNRTFTLAPGPPTIPALGGYGLVAADFDKDGKQDLVVRNAAPAQILFLKGKGDGTFEAGVALPGDLLQASDFAAADLNGDGNPDLVAVSGWGYPTSVWLGNGNGTFQAPATYDHGGGMGSSQISVADFDGDGKLDLGIANNVSFAILPGKGDGTFAPRQLYAVGRTSPCAAVGDFDKDGKPDVAAAHPPNGQSQNTITLLLNDSGPRTSLSLTKSQTPNPAEVGQVITYTITVANAGPDPATDVVVRDPLRRDFAFLTATPSAGTCSHTPTVLTCALGTLAPSATATITVTAMALKIGYLANTASVTSGVADLNLADNAAAAGQSVTGGLQVLGPGRTTPGAEYDYLVRWLNVNAFGIEDAVVVLELPLTAGFVSGSPGAVYRTDTHEVFWRLGDLAAYAKGNVTAKVRIRWGTLPHQMQAFVGRMGWSLPAGSDFDVTPYLSWVAREPVSRHDLSPAEIAALLAVDPRLQSLRAAALSRGLADFNVASTTVLSDGSSVTSLSLADPTPGQVSFLSTGDGASLLTTIGPEFFEVADETGGLRWNRATWTSEYRGAWAAAPLGPLAGKGPGPSLLALSATHRTCLDRCNTLNVMTNILTTIQPELAIPLAAPSCVKCIVSGVKDYAACADCLANIQQRISFLPGVATASVLCEKDCKECDKGVHEKCYHCDVPSYKRCIRSFFPYNLTPGVNWMVETMDCDPPTGNWDRHAVEACPPCKEPTPIQVCKKAVCGCECNKGKASLFLPPSETGKSVLAGPLCDPWIDGTVSEAITAHDPNAKSGPPGDVVAGEELSYRVDYENTGAGTAYGVYVVDELDPALDAATLVIGSGGVFFSSTRLVFWDIGDLAPGATGSVAFHVRVRSDADPGAQIVNVARVVFPSVPEVTATNPVVSTIRAVVADPQVVTTPEETAVPVPLRGHDPASRPLTFAVTVPPSGGMVTGAPPDVTYVPSAGFEGEDRFLFTASNGLTASEPALVRVVVTPSAADTTAPRVLGVAPALGQSVASPQVPLVSGFYLPQIAASFDEALDPASATTNNVDVRIGGAPVSGAVEFWPGANRLVFTPSQPIPPGAEVAVTLGIGLHDSSGNALEQPYGWTFRTFGAEGVGADPAVADFGQTGRNVTRTLDVWVVNTGAADLSITGYGLLGSVAFDVTADGCTGLAIVPGGRCAYTVSYTPPAAGPDAGTLTVSTSAGTLNVPLAGSGVVVGGKLYTVPPCRVLDTRDPPGPHGGPSLAPSSDRIVAFPSSCGIPGTATAISANLTVTGTQAPGFLTAWPADGTRPLASTVNFSPGQTRANNAVVPLSSDGAGQARFFNGSLGTLDVIVDVNGYFE